MKHRHTSSFFTSRLGIFIIVVAVVVLALIVFGSRGTPANNQDNKTTENESALLETQDTTPVQAETEPENGILEEVIEKTLSEKGLCEDYNFNEGDALEIKDSTVLVERISSSSVKMTVDGTTFFLAPSKDEVVNGLRVELKDGNLHYFGAGDSENVVVLRVGCKYSDEDPNEKYVRERGEDLCQEIYRECRDSFGLK